MEGNLTAIIGYAVAVVLLVAIIAGAAIRTNAKTKKKRVRSR